MDSRVSALGHGVRWKLAGNRLVSYRSLGAESTARELQRTRDASAARRSSRFIYSHCEANAAPSAGARRTPAAFTTSGCKVAARDSKAARHSAAPTRNHGRRPRPADDACHAHGNGGREPCGRVPRRLRPPSYSLEQMPAQDVLHALGVRPSET